MPEGPQLKRFAPNSNSKLLYRPSLRRQHRIPNHKQHRQNPQQHANFSPLPRRQFRRRVRNHSQAQPRSNTERQRRRHQRHKRRKRFRKFLPLHLRNRFRHQCAHQHQRRRGRKRRNRRRHRRKKHRRQKQRRHHHVAQSRSCPRRHTRRALDVTRHSRSPGHGAENRPNPIRQQHPPHARNFSIFHKPALLAHAHHRSHVVEQIHKQKNKNNLHQPQVQRPTQIHLQKRG